jgi:hypothetical protein
MRRLVLYVVMLLLTFSIVTALLAVGEKLYAGPPAVTQRP